MRGNHWSVAATYRFVHSFDQSNNTAYFFATNPKTNAVFYCNFFWPIHLVFFVIHNTHNLIKPRRSTSSTKTVLICRLRCWDLMYPMARCKESENKSPKDRLNIQVPGLAVPGGTWFTRLVQSGDKNSAYSLFRYLQSMQIIITG